MTWAKLSDTLDEDLLYLSDAAFRLFICALTWSRRRELGGRLSPRELSMLCRSQSTAPGAVDELLGRDGAEEPLWLCEDDGMVTIRNYERFNPLTSKERMRAHRARTRVTSDADVTSPRAGVRARREEEISRTRYPEPVVRGPGRAYSPESNARARGPEPTGALIEAQYGVL